MEGYSVTEAASVLGVPTERVWELLARGVLAGTPEGDTGMRVFLQPRPAPAPSPMEMPPPRAVEREPERELSPFRELLTEFRNLTERYGQALLALGEARGEVAALRSRVDLLEARMDLRLPAAPAAPEWERPTPVAAPGGRWPVSDHTQSVEEAPPAPVSETVEPSEPEASPEPEAPSGSEVVDATDTPDRQARRRRSGHRWSTEDFAEALARAEDPTAPILPGARDAAAAFAAFEAEPVESEVDDVAEVLPEPEPVGIEPEPVDTVAEPGAEPAADETGADVPPEGEQEAEPMAAEPEPAAAGTEPVAIVPEPVSEPLVPEPEPAVAEPEPAPEPPDVEAAPLDWDPQRYTTEIVEPDWYAEEDPPHRSAPSPSAETTRVPDETTHQAPEPVADASEPEPPEPAEDDGASEMEVPARGRPTDDLEGRAAARFEEALAALDALSRSSPASRPSEPIREGDTGATTTSSEPTGGTPPVRRPVSRPLHPGPTPASRAYRRLRRIFPG